MSYALFYLLERMKDESTFLAFVEAVKAERASEENQRDVLDESQRQWANNSIAAFLEAATAWAHDSEFGARPGPKPGNPWQLFAQFIWAGRGNE